MRTVVDSGTAGPDRTPVDLLIDDGGTTLIEASAGTGKTRARTILVICLAATQP